MDRSNNQTAANGYPDQYQNDPQQQQHHIQQADVWNRQQHQLHPQGQVPGQPQLISVPLVHHQLPPQYQAVPAQMWNGQVAIAAPHGQVHQPPGVPANAHYSPYAQIQYAYSPNQPIGLDPNSHSPQYAYVQQTPQLVSTTSQEHIPHHHQQQQPHMIESNSIATPSTRTYTHAFNEEPNTASSTTETKHMDALNSALKNPIPPYAIATTNNTNGRRSKTPTSNNGSNANTSPTNEANPNAAKKGFRNSRRRHRNSHLGCATCKSRRIKCDEQLPQCKNCVRARLSCAYLALDDAAREALKTAQQAHAARLQSLTVQSNAQNQKSQQQNQHYHHNQIQQQMQQHSYPYPNQPYFAPGLPSRIFVNSLPPLAQQQQYQPEPQQQQQQPLQHIPIQVNLQKPLLPPLEFPFQQTNGSTTISNNNSPTESIKRPKSTGSETSSSATSVSGAGLNDTSGGNSAINSISSRFSIQADSFNSLATLIGKHKDIDPRISDQNPQFPEEFTEIVLDPNCTKHLNQIWEKIDWSLIKKFRSGFEPEWLYDEYDRYHNLLMKEAENNIVLFKSLLSTGAVLLTQYSKDQQVREIASRQLNKEFEIVLRFLDKFKIDLTKEVNDPKVFYDNVNIAFSKFQIFQTAIPTTYFGSHNMNDNVELTSRFFNFIISYLNNEFVAFKDEEIVQKYKQDELFKQAGILNEYMGVFIIYYVQCIKAYHTASYNTVFFQELINNIEKAKPLIYDKLSKDHQKDYDNLVEFTTKLNEYFVKLRSASENSKNLTNELQVLFYTMKKWYSILPEQLYIDQQYPDEVYVLYAYFHATISSLIAIFPETRFYFIYSFNGRDGTRTANPILNYYNNETTSTEIKEALKYPVKLIEFFKKRTLLLSQYLSDVSNLPAKILLDESNRHILRNLVKEEQLTSFEVGNIDESAYPNIDQTSSFYNKESNSIIIPSLSSGHGFSNFEKAQLKRESLLKKSVEDGLTTIDKTLIDSFFTSPSASSSVSPTI